MTASARRRLAVASAPVLGGGLEFLRLIRAIDHRLEVTSRRLEQTVGVTAPQQLVLHVLGRFPGLTLSRLAALLHVHPSNAGSIVARLERRGLVARRSDTRDRRRAYLGLTPRGRRLDSQSARAVEAALDRALSRVGPRAVHHAREVLLALAGELEGPRG